MSKSQLIINLIKKEILYYENIKIFNTLYYIKDSKQIKVKVPDNLFDLSKEKKATELYIYGKDILTEISKFKINVYYGVTQAYLFLSKKNKGNNVLIEALFKEDERIF